MSDVEELLRLARDKSVEGRNRLAATVSDLFCGQNEVLSDKERALMMDILRQLIHDVEMSVRQTLAEKLADQPNAPHELILSLANDEIEVAHPILEKSSLLFDDELIEIIHHRTMQHQLTIAMRREVSENVSTALVETGNGDVITTLLENKNAKISRTTMDYLVDQSKHIDQYQNPLVRRPDLPQDLAKKMVYWVSAALRQHIAENFAIDPTDLDDSLEEATEKTFESIDHDADNGTLSEALAKNLSQSEKITPKFLIQVLRQGEIPLFEAALGKMMELRPNLVRRLIYEPGGEGLAIACKSIDIPKADFASIFLLSRKARPGDKIVDPGELSRTLELYDRIKQPSAITVIKHWRRDPKYLDSIRRLAEDLRSESKNDRRTGSPNRRN